MNKVSFFHIFTLIPLYFVLFAVTSWADTSIVFRDGEEYRGSIIQQTDKVITLKSAGGDYYLPVKDIQTINGNIFDPNANYMFTFSPHAKQIPESNKSMEATGTNASPMIITKTFHVAIDTRHIDQVLEHLGYSQKKWPAIEKEVVVLLKKIDFPHLKKEASQVKSDPAKLKKFLAKLGKLIDQEGNIDHQGPHPLTKLLTISFVDDDLSQEILTSSITFGQKVESIKSLSACTAISQLGSIILALLDINVKVAFSPGHVFNCIPLDDNHVLFADFSNQIFEIVDIKEYYSNFLSRTELLKDQYHISPERLLEIKAQLPSEYQSDSLEELLHFLYLYIYISDDYTTTPAIFLNLGNIYASKAKYEQAILYYNQAIAINPDYPEAYHGRGITYGNEGNLTQAIADISKAIELFPEFAEAYHDRGSIYGSRGEIDNAINDFNQAVTIDPNYTKAYLDRGAMYNNKGDVDQAISDYSKAIEIDPYYSDAYKARAEAYFLKREYDKARSDIHKLEDFGDEVSPELMEKLKNASTSKNFSVILVGTPIVILLIFFFLK